MSEPASAFTPLPLRARSVLELLDTSLKVYKQYFWVLLGWSALLNIFGALASTVCSVFGQLLFTPIFLGVVACCVAAAVRGQNVSFSQCWQFAQARFGGMLGWFLATMFITFVVLGVLCGVFIGLFALLAGGIFSGNSSAGTVVVVVYTVLASVVISIVGAALFTWAHIAPLVECMEENNREKKTLPRSWALMQGHWMRATSLMTILSLAAAVLLVIIWTAGALIIGIDTLRQAFEGSVTPSILLIVGAMISSYALVFTLFTPAFLIAIVLFYLDIRVRKDALDLEWTTHTTAPPASAVALSAANAHTPYAVSGFENLTPVQPATQPIIQQPIQPPAPQVPPLQYQPSVPSQPLAGAPLASEPAPTANAFEGLDFGSTPFAPPPEAVSWQSLVEEPPAATEKPDAEAANATTEITCPACGKQSPANYLFCMSCGVRLSAAPANTPKW